MLEFKQKKRLKERNKIKIMRKYCFTDGFWEGQGIGMQRVKFQETHEKG